MTHAWFHRLRHPWFRQPLPLQALALAALCALLFADLAGREPGTVLSLAGTDLDMQFVGWRQFGFGELAKGNLALWNPHIYGGAPFFGGFQAALLYPPNWLHLILPLPTALNAGIILHLWLAGLWTALWLNGRRLHLAAALAGAILFQLCGAHFWHIMAGHLANLCTLAWAPLLWAAVDGVLERRGRRWAWAGAAAVALMILAGHPQYVFYIGIATAGYALLRLPDCPARGPALLELAALNLLALGATAIQWLPGLQAAGECVRQGGVSYEFAAMFAFPPENLVTLVAPDFFGGVATALPYWGRCYQWEMTLFLGAAGTLLIVAGAGWREHRRAWAALLLLAAALFILALGRHTPLFSLLYRHALGFNLFRSVSKFILPMSLALAGAAALGFDGLLRRARWPGWLPAIAATTALLLALAALALLRTPQNPAASAWGRWLARRPAAGESYLPPELYAQADFQAAAARAAARGLLPPATAAAIFALATGLAWRRPGAAAPAGTAILLLLAAETALAASRHRPLFNLATAAMAEVAARLPEPRDAYRVLNQIRPAAGLLNGSFDLWGPDPLVPRRTAELLFASQGANPAAASQYLPFRQPHPWFRLLRGRFVVQPHGSGLARIQELPSPLPRWLLLRDWRLATSRDAAFRALAPAQFDPTRTVLLETPPDPAPDPALPPADPAAIRILAEDSDHTDLELRLDAPAILLQTDSWTAGWRATTLPGTSQAAYRLQPGDYALRAIPLAAGFHRLRIEYRPATFAWGLAISALSLLAAAGLAASEWRRHRRRAAGPGKGDN
ncbi:MAG: hypothetical protein WC789_06660 [Lentisphaeria bacterium]